MNEKRTRALLDSGVHMIDISIDAFTPETYAAVRVGGDLGVTSSNVLRLIEWVRTMGSSTRVVVSFVEQPRNIHETEHFRLYWLDKGVDEVVVRRLHSAAGALIQEADLLREEQAESFRYPCLYPWERITLNPMGSLSFCPTDWVHGSIIPEADYHSTTIQAIWQGSFMRHLREAHLCGDFRSHGFCGQCPDWQNTRWPGQGRSYADLVEELRGDGNCE